MPWFWPLMLAGVAGGSAWLWIVYRPAVQIQRHIEGAEKQVRRVLADPDSAQFREVAYYPSTGSACGQVNMKNRMGGYVGYTNFVVTKDAAVQLEPGGTETSDLEAKLAALNKKVAFFDIALANCPEKKAGSAPPGTAKQ